jgi:diaminopimelate decarboxylase
MANLMRPGMYGAYHHITIPRIQKTFQRNDVMITSESDLMKAHIVGTLCENNDWFASDRLLPAETKKGDLFIIYDTGAHSHSMGFQYNSKLRAPEILLFKSKFGLIRKRETYDSLFGNCIKFDL